MVQYRSAVYAWQQRQQEARSRALEVSMHCTAGALRCRIESPLNCAAGAAAGGEELNNNLVQEKQELQEQLCAEIDLMHESLGSARSAFLG